MIKKKMPLTPNEFHSFEERYAELARKNMLNCLNTGISLEERDSRTMAFLRNELKSFLETRRDAFGNEDNCKLLDAFIDFCTETD